MFSYELRAFFIPTMCSFKKTLHQYAYLNLMQALIQAGASAG